tara:strand:- start:15738 stop:16097 length:360 start_codon:yes stop_codon:yes gene_type:complete
MRLFFILGILVAVYLFIFGLGTFKNVEAGEWNDKPVMCEQKDIALKAIKDKGEIPLITAIQSTKVRDTDGLSDVPAHVPLQIFVNINTKTFSILEFHPSYNSICIIGYGDDWTMLGEKS